MKSEKIERIVDLAATLAARADELDQVLILYRMKEDASPDNDAVHGSMDNGLQVDAALWLASGFIFWLQAFSIGLLKRKDGE